jgi:hypothetical protein
VLPIAAAMPPPVGLLMFSFICLNDPDSRGAAGATPEAPPSCAPAALASFARVASIRAADSAAKLVSTIGAAPPVPAITGFFFALVVAFFAPADLVVILLTFGFVVRGFVVLGFVVFGFVIFAALADFVVAFFTAGFPVPLLLAFAI